MSIWDKKFQILYVPSKDIGKNKKIKNRVKYIFKTCNYEYYPVKDAYFVLSLNNENKDAIQAVKEDSSIIKAVGILYPKLKVNYEGYNKVSEFYSFCTDKDYRGKGYGTRMLLSLVKNAEYPVWLGLDCNNKCYDNLLKMYIRSGFGVVKIETESPSGKKFYKKILGLLHDPKKEIDFIKNYELGKKLKL